MLASAAQIRTMAMEPENSKCFVGGIPFTMDKRGIEDTFGKYGHITDIRARSAIADL